MLFTLQLTLVLLVFVTVAVNVNWFPSRTVLAEDLTVTAMEGGGGGGGATAPPPPQPSVHPPVVRRAMTIALALLNSFPLLCGRGRMPCAKQAKGQRTKVHCLLGARS
jgi:hypothetical protein